MPIPGGRNDRMHPYACERDEQFYNVDVNLSLQLNFFPVGNNE